MAEASTVLAGFWQLPSWPDLQPFLVAGLALGGVYALSGVGMVVLYRATGVLNLAFGGVGAMGAFIAWQLINSQGVGFWPAFLVCVLFGAVTTLAYGAVFGRRLADRDPVVKAVATLGLTLVLLGTMDLLWTSSGGQSRAILFPTDNSTFTIGSVQVTYTQVIGLVVGIVVTAVTAAFLRYSKLGTAMRAMANDRELTAALGVPVRRVEAAAWLGCGVLSGVAGMLLASFVALDSTTLTFLVISSLSATLIARLRSVTVTFLAAILIGVVEAVITPISALSDYRVMTPFVFAAVALLILNRRRVIVVGRQGV
ncbi:branched-chain amino acid ABC transporter permease [Actinoplanes subtropicus]|uniref:branched-chain amino acid ABC transporter permease n=1 Tax=Actinoplanes subtropicus TaxID=543632 RepID=UPI00068AF2F8|nr:branched-chain amino acid ABC transporter permease [Actinoplanes subtropicus]